MRSISRYSVTGYVILVVIIVIKQYHSWLETPGHHSKLMYNLMYFFPFSFTVRSKDVWQFFKYSTATGPGYGNNTECARSKVGWNFRTTHYQFLWSIQDKVYCCSSYWWFWEQGRLLKYCFYFDINRSIMDESFGQFIVLVTDNTLWKCSICNANYYYYFWILQL